MKIKLDVLAIDFAQVEDEEIEFDVVLDHIANTVDIKVEDKIYTVDMREFISMTKAFS
jgi:hypothetical protein